MVKIDSFRDVNGFNTQLIAGEEPEMCLRLRQKGGKIFRIDKPMTVHDAKIENFSQWWARAGYAYALWANMCPEDTNLMEPLLCTNLGMGSINTNCNSCINSALSNDCVERSNALPDANSTHSTSREKEVSE
jgi:hypothetical protein